jgi:hypothetical protein
MAPPRKPRRFWRLCRIYFRRVRITVWLLLLLLLGTALYVNQVGLPGFLKRPLLEKLRARGLDLQFSRLRLRWYHGIVAENVRFGGADDPQSPRLTASEVQVRLNRDALWRLKLQLDAVVLRHGELTIPVVQTNLGRQQLTVSNIQTELRFLPGDQWSLDDFKAGFAGAGVRLSGIVTNASAVRDWKFIKQEEETGPSAQKWQQRLNRLADCLQRIRFSAPPELVLDVRGDALDLQSFGVLMLISAPGAETPWGELAQGRFRARVYPADTNRCSRAKIELEASHAGTQWGEITNLALEMNFNSTETSDLIEGRLKLAGDRVDSPWASGTNALFQAHWMHSMTNPIPLSGEGHCEFQSVGTRWGKARGLQLSAVARRAPAAEALLEPSLGWWTNLQPYLLDWDCQAEAVDTPQVQATALACGGTWHAPELAVTNLHVALYKGHLDAGAHLDVSTRELRASLASDFDPRKISALLTEGGRRWLEPYEWSKPPLVQAEARVVLPAWTNSNPDWRAEVQPTLWLQGQLNVTEGGSYRQVPVDTLRSHFIYSNLTWHLPDLTLTRREGTVRAEHRANDQTKDFYWHVTGAVNPEVLRPLLGIEEQRGLDLFTLSQAPVIDAEVWGRFQEAERTGFKARVAITNFSFRGEAISSVVTGIHYTNRVLEFFAPNIECSTQHVRADGLTVDFNTQLAYLTNGYSTADPMMIARAIGPRIAEAIEPYQFLRPPTAHVFGTIPLRGEEGADLHFYLDGGPFHWWKFNMTEISGHVHWEGLRLSLTQMAMPFYGGHAEGSAGFAFPPGEPVQFHFTVAVTHTLLHALMTDLVRTNHLEGRLTGNLDITRASVADWRSVNGYGNLDLRDGLIWDIPLFGIFSPVLNGIVPGLGNSRATAGICSFVITNGVLFSNDLEIRAATMRLQYRGTVDLEQHLNARVEAELLRDMWVIGPLISTVFWPVTKLFEYKVAGTLPEPRTEPVFIIPKLVLMPFHPFRTLKGLFPEENGSRTNAPNASPSH